MTERHCVDALSTLQVDLWMETDEFLRFWSTYSFGTRRTAFYYYYGSLTRGISIIFEQKLQMRN